MHPLNQYHEAILGIFERIVAERDHFDRAAAAIARRIIEGRVIHVFGTGGHSIMGSEEIFCRAGGFACVNAILDPNLSYVNSARRTTLTERTVGYAKTALDFYEVQPGDLIIIVNVNGINAVTIDAAMEAHRRGMEVVAVTSREFSDHVPPEADSRHPSKKNLYELADYVLDVHVPAGDALLELEGIPVKVSAGSTVALTFALNCLMATVARVMADQGVEPPILRSGNLPGGLDYNKKLRAKYMGRVKNYV